MKKCLITVIIILVSSTNSAFCLPALLNPSGETQKQAFGYPIKRESFKELVQLYDKFVEIDEDVKLLSSKDDKTKSGVLANALLRIFQAEMDEAYMVAISMLGLEAGHGNANQFNTGAIRDIIKAIEMYIPSYGGRVERINETITNPLFTDNNLVIILCEKLKEYNRESKRLMQKMVKELENTIKILEANEHTP